MRGCCAVRGCNIVKVLNNKKTEVASVVKFEDEYEYHFMYECACATLRQHQ